MSRWISQEAERLAPYTPGEQPQDQPYAANVMSFFICKAEHQ